MNILCISVLICMMSISSLSAALTPHTLSYELSRADIVVGSEKRILSQKEGRYTYSASMRTEGLVKLFFDYSIDAQSSFTLSPYITPLSASVIETKSDEIVKDITMVFDESEVRAGELVWNSNTRMIDILSLFLALGDDVKHNRELRYTLATGKELKEHTFVQKDAQTMYIMGEEIEVIELSNNADITVFISPKYAYLPVFITKKKWQYKLKNIDLKYNI